MTTTSDKSPQMQDALFRLSCDDEMTASRPKSFTRVDALTAWINDSRVLHHTVAS